MFAALRSRKARVIALGTAVAVSGVLSACTPAPAGPKIISGTLQGNDGKFVDAMLGFDVIDAHGNKIDMGLLGQTGYSTIQRINHCVPVSGSAAPMNCAGGATTKNWSLRLPANATTVYIEVYPKAPTPTAWVNNYRGYTGPAAGDTDKSYYGMVFRRALPVGGAGQSNVAIRLPDVCSKPGASTGSLVGHVAGYTGGEVDAWSMAPDGPMIGFGIATVDGNGNYALNGMQAGQRYGLIAHAPGRATKNVVDYRRATSSDTLIPGTCAVKRFDF